MALLLPCTASAYPLDGAETTGIARLEGYQLAQQGKARGPKVPTGGLLTMTEVDIRLQDWSSMNIPEPDPAFSEAITKMLGSEADLYGLAVFDLTDPENPKYAAHRELENFNPGSVGKLMITLGIFQALADTYPQNLEARQRVLKESMVTADRFIITDSHKVPFWSLEQKTLSSRPLREGDSANLWSFMDYMLSASSNAAGSMVLKELLLLTHFGKDYPVSEAQKAEFYAKTPKKELSAILERALKKAGERNGLDSEQLRQGGFFTSVGKKMVQGTNSRANARTLMQYLLRMEQGRLVDAYSSREIKRLLYMTQRRIRFASSPALSDAAIYFKSGSLFKCRPEPGFVCKKYHGNETNMMNSVAIVEYPARGRKYYYLAVVMSNVLRKNSAVEHQTFATRLQKLIESFHPELKEPEPDKPARQGKRSTR